MKIISHIGVVVAITATMIGSAILWISVMGAEFTSIALYVLIVLILTGSLRFGSADEVSTRNIPDPAARREAAHLIRRLRDGDISNDTFRNEWPRRSDDALLQILFDRISRYCEGGHEHTLTGRYALSTQDRETFTRTALFADGDLPYEWEDFVKQKGLGYFWLIAGAAGWSVALRQFGGWIVAVAICSLFLLHLVVKRVQIRSQKEIEQKGDFAVWPFFRVADYETAKAESSVRQSLA